MTNKTIFIPCVDIPVNIRSRIVVTSDGEDTVLTPDGLILGPDGEVWGTWGSDPLGFIAIYSADGRLMEGDG